VHIILFGMLLLTEFEKILTQIWNKGLVKVSKIKGHKQVHFLQLFNYIANLQFLCQFLMAFQIKLLTAVVNPNAKSLLNFKNEALPP
jgi:hypothetical protein